MSRRHRPRRGKTVLQRKAQKGFRGYPIATIAYYGPDDKFASKVAVGIILQEDGDVAFLERWFSQDKDVRTDPAISREIVEFIREMLDPPKFKIQIVLSSQPDTVDLVVDFLTLSSVNYDAMTITGTLAPNDPLSMPAIDSIYSGVEFPDLIYGE